MAPRTVRVIGALWRAELAKSFTYRADLVVGLVVNGLWLSAVILPVLFAFDRADSTNGWSMGQLLVVQAVWWLLDAVLWMFIIPNMADLSNRVANGELDMVLLKPVNSLLYCSVRQLIIHDLLKLPLAFILAGYGMAISADTGITIGGLAMGLLAIVSAMVLMWSIGVLAHAKAITSVRFDAGWLAVGALNLARVPSSFYGPALRIFMTAVIPIAFLTTVPVQLFYGLVAWWMGPISVVVAAVSVKLAAVVWGHQIQRYDGAMS